MGYNADKFQGIPLPLISSEDDGKYAKYNHSSHSFIMSESVNNYSIVSQNIPALTRTYIAGTNINFISVNVGTIFSWDFTMTKTAAGLATSVFDIAFGRYGTIEDTARISFTKPAGTAVIDEAMINIKVVVRGYPSLESGTVAGTFLMTHNLLATGHAIIPCVVVTAESGLFDLTDSTNVGICLTTGLSDDITIQLVTAHAENIK